MSEAIGIHDHQYKKLGARPEDKQAPKLLFAHHLAAIPEHPIVDPKPVGVSYPMDKNDAAGDCVVAGVNHFLQAIYNLLGIPFTPWTLDQILAFYQTQNPGFTSWDSAGSQNDGGMVIAQFLSYLVKQGHILGFAKVDTGNPEELRAALYLGLAIVVGVNLQGAQQSGKVWDFVPGSSDWGGHCTTEVGYDQDGLTTVTWGEDDYKMTNSFISNCMDEAYFIITRAHVEHPSFRQHFDLYSFSQAFQAITGSPFPVVVTPPPAPVPPSPAPSGGGASFPVSAEVAAVVHQRAVRARMTDGAWLDHHLRVTFGLPH